MNPTLNPKLDPKTTWLIIALIYLISPVDAVPGSLFDDLVALVFALAPFFHPQLAT